jgi:hypothetical protein
MGGSLPQLIALNDVIVSDKLRNMAQMAVVVFVLGAIILRSLVGGLFVVTPLFAVMLANFGLMGWLRTPLDISAMTTARWRSASAPTTRSTCCSASGGAGADGQRARATRASMLTSGRPSCSSRFRSSPGYCGAAGVGIRRSTTRCRAW